MAEIGHIEIPIINDKTPYYYLYFRFNVTQIDFYVIPMNDWDEIIIGIHKNYHGVML